MEASVFGCSMKYTTLSRHSVGGWDMHLSGLIFVTGNTYWGMTSTSSGWQSTSDWGRYETFRRRDDVLSTTFTGEGTLFVADDGGSDEEEEDSRFRAYSPSAYIHNVDLSQDEALEFPDLPHRRRDRTSLSLDLGEMEVGREFSNKDSFLGTLKQHSIMNGVSYNVVKSKSDKFEAKYAVQDDTCSWKIMVSLRKRTGLCEIKKYKVNEEGTDYLHNIPFEQWTQAYDGLQYACQNLRLDPMTYVDQVYKIEYMYSVWRHVFPLIPDERKWPSESLAPFKLLTDRELRRKLKGRPCSTRIRNNMDIRETMNQ
ncbi:hypothetical protein PVK06_043037 [Gossypium arboreum]|uniref:Transposase MuDR plant domain-containing protein n=1 Tax=Gossypium arboreum TaxID=29729 RepID=A0ABR0MMH6_GOSAR|nr:hypothetical protein PVK06_043037 [Gossypium arboreum]